MIITKLNISIEKMITDTFDEKKATKAYLSDSPKKKKSEERPKKKKEAEKLSCNEIIIMIFIKIYLTLFSLEFKKKKKDLEKIQKKKEEQRLSKIVSF